MNTSLDLLKGVTAFWVKLPQHNHLTGVNEWWLAEASRDTSVLLFCFVFGFSTTWVNLTMTGCAYCDDKITLGCRMKTVAAKDSLTQLKLQETCDYATFSFLFFCFKNSCFGFNLRCTFEVNQVHNSGLRFIIQGWFTSHYQLSKTRRLQRERALPFVCVSAHVHARTEISVPGFAERH